MRDDPPVEMTPDEARRDHRSMLRFMAVNALIGMTIGAAVAAALIWLDIGGVGTRIGRAGNPVVPVLLMVVPLASLFGGGAVATAIMMMPYKRKYRR